MRAFVDWLTDGQTQAGPLLFIFGFVGGVAFCLAAVVIFLLHMVMK